MTRHLFHFWADLDDDTLRRGLAELDPTTDAEIVADLIAELTHRARQDSASFGEWAVANVPGLRERLRTAPTSRLRLTKGQFLRRYGLDEPTEEGATT